MFPPSELSIEKKVGGGKESNHDSIHQFTFRKSHTHKNLFKGIIFLGILRYS